MEVNRIYCESNIETMRRMPDGFVDLTVTSPPYDDLRVYRGFEFDVVAVAEGLYRVTKDGGVVVWVVCDRTVNGDETGTSFHHAQTFKKAGFQLWDTMIFGKNNGFPGDIRKRYRQSFEYMFCFTKGTPETFNPIQVPTANAGAVFSAARLEREGRNYLDERSKTITVAPMRNASNIFFYSVGIPVNGNAQQLEAFKHPAVFPLQLAKDQILSWSNENDLIYDCFLGSGTTAIAAHQLKRNWIGSEISAEYVALANKRLEPYLAQEQLF